MHVPVSVVKSVLDDQFQKFLEVYPELKRSVSTTTSTTTTLSLGLGESIAPSIDMTWDILQEIAGTPDHEDTASTFSHGMVNICCYNWLWYVMLIHSTITYSLWILQLNPGILYGRRYITLTTV